MATSRSVKTSFKRFVASSPEDLCGNVHQVRIDAVADETLLGEIAD